jgi:signal transduction histidine kinase
LLTNAIKFTGRQGKVEIYVELMPFEDRFETHLRFQVKDNGLGIKKKYHKKLFKMFGSIKNEKR